MRYLPLAKAGKRAQKDEQRERSLHPLLLLKLPFLPGKDYALRARVSEDLK